VNGPDIVRQLVPRLGSGDAECSFSEP